MHNLPPNWSWVKLGDVCNKLTDGSHYSPKTVSAGLPYVTVKDVLKDKINFDGCKRIAKSDYLKLVDNDCKPLKNDVLFSKDGTVGKVSLIDFEKEFVVLSSLAILRPNIKSIIPKYLFHFLKSSTFLNQALSKKKGVAIRRIILRDLKELDVILPPLKEQKKIVEKIEELFSQMESGVASLKKAKEQIRLYRQSVLAFAFSGRLLGKDDIFQKETSNAKDVIFSGKAAEPKVEYSNQLPEGWKWVKLGEATQINPKLPFEEIDGNILVSFLPMRQVEELNGKFDLSMERKYSEVKKGFTPFTNGDVIFAKITPCMENGKIAVLSNLRNNIGFGSTEFHVFRTKNELNNQYLFYFLIQDTFRAKAQHNMTGAVGQKRVPRRFLEESEIALPPLNQQTQIVEEIEKRFSEADNLEKAIDDSLAKSERLRQSILKQAFEGKLV